MQGPVGGSTVNPEANLKGW